MAIDKILGRLDSLISMGEKVLTSRRLIIPLHKLSNEYADYGLFRQWRTSSVAFLKTLPPEYIYSHEFEAHCKDAHLEYVKEGLAILQAARDDIAGGYLQKVEALVSASVFSDFLEMSEHLLDNGYKDPAASLIGAVLEDGLRRICVNNGITLKTKEDISSLNQKLAQKQVYNPLQQKQIQVWNEIRNNADHCNFDQYKMDDVKDMLGGVRSFLSEHLK